MATLIILFSYSIFILSRQCGVVNTCFDFDNFNFVSNIVNNNINFSFSSLNAGGNIGNSGGFDSMLKDASDYTSGGGGFSSGGGGGGSFGGGGGGGGFR